MDPWVIWLVVTVALAVGEILTTSFFLAPFAIGTALAAAVSLTGAGELAAWLVFASATAASFAFLRPVARRHLHQPAHLRSGTAALVGCSATVVERISNGEGSGQVKLEGEIWSARAFQEGESFEPGARVQVIEIRGATALVDDL